MFPRRKRRIFPLCQGRIRIFSQENDAAYQLHVCFRCKFSIKMAESIDENDNIGKSHELEKRRLLDARERSPRVPLSIDRSRSRTQLLIFLRRVCFRVHIVPESVHKSRTLLFFVDCLPRVCWRAVASRRRSSVFGLDQPCCCHHARSIR